jgi:DNA-binding CsgD family transcriptional regulator
MSVSTAPVVWDEPAMITIAESEGLVLERLLNGMEYKRIASELKIRHSSVKTLVQRVLRSFNVENRHELSALVFIMNGWKEGRRKRQPTVVRIIVPREGTTLCFERTAPAED